MLAIRFGALFTITWEADGVRILVMGNPSVFTESEMIEIAGSLEKVNGPSAGVSP